MTSNVLTESSTRETAGALLLDVAGRALLGLRGMHKRAGGGCWDIIGGHVEPSETIEQALLRELHEEIGVIATIYFPLVSLREPAPANVVHHVFAVTGWTGEPMNACDEHVEIRWFTPSELVRLPNKTAFDFVDLLHRAAHRRD